MSQPNLDPAEQQIFSVLADRKAMPFLELASQCKLSNTEISAAVDRLSEKGLVTVTNPSSVFDEIISVTGEGFRSGLASARRI